MLSKYQRSAIIKVVLSKLKLEQQRKELKPKIIDTYCDMVWNDLMTPEMREFFKSNPTSVNLKRSLSDYSSIFRWYSALFDHYCFIEVPKCIRNWDLYYFVQDIIGNWFEDMVFNMEGTKGHEYFKEFPLTVKIYDYREGKYKDTEEKAVWVPNIGFTIEEDEKTPGRFFIKAGDMLGGKEIPSSPTTEAYIKTLADYVGICRKMYNIVESINNLLEKPGVTITYLRKNFPELLIDVTL